MDLKKILTRWEHEANDLISWAEIRSEKGEKKEAELLKAKAKIYRQCAEDLKNNLTFK